MTIIQQPKAAGEFAQRWQGKGYEKGESHIFWIELLSQVFGIDTPSEFLHFEQQVHLDHTSFIDAYIPRTHVMIEQKSIEKDLGAPIKQSDGSLLNPFQQAKRYAAELPYSQRPRWIVTCNFREFWVYDMEQPNGEPQKILLANLEKEYYRLQFLVDEGNEHLRREMEVSVKAGELVGMIYDKLLEQYTLGTAVAKRSSPASQQNDNAGETTALQADILRSLNILCVRLVFCLYAEDAGLFPSRTSFHDYLAQFQPKHIRKALIDLFEVLDTPLDRRDPYLDEDLAVFPYVNGGLFGNKHNRWHNDKNNELNKSNNNELNELNEPVNSYNSFNSHNSLFIIPQFTEELKTLLLEKASADFDWSEISPTIFGAVFESTLNPETRRSGGMHYTSIENIHKVIDPLFMNDLRAEFVGILGAAVAKRSSPASTLGAAVAKQSSPASDTSQQVRTGTSAFQVRQALAAFQDKLASLTFFDPACGSGNFLTETYLSLRRLENEVIQAMYGGANILTFDTLIKVNISQFHGIEINDFACTVAKTALWIAENQMMQQTSAIAGKPMDFLPLKTNANIHEGNALRMDWAELGARSSSPASPYTYIIGNPPFVGARLMSKEQKDDLLGIFGKKWKNLGNMDYVCGWYKKAAELMAAWSASVPTGSASVPTRGNSTAGNSPSKLEGVERSAGGVCPKPIRAALVSTNSITQGEQVANLWKPLFEDYGLHIDFAYRTFRWDSEADIKAHVHCVIIGFSRSASVPTRDERTQTSSPAQKENDYKDSIGIAKGYTNDADGDVRAPRIFLSDNHTVQARHINAYLMDAPDVWIESRQHPLCDVPEIGIGNKPIDGGNYLFTEDEMREFIRKEPKAAQYFRPWYGAEEFINGKRRFCLWLGDCTPQELRSLPLCYERVAKVREYRLASPSEGTRKLADRPTRFHVENMPTGNYLLIPRVSSERRRYIPIGFMQPEMLSSDSVHIIPSATLYHFGVLTSNVHMAWMRVVCGRLKSDYRYSKDIVYNNFLWPYALRDLLGAWSSSPALTAEEREDIEARLRMMAGGDDRVPNTAQAILDARALYPDSSLADLYDEVTMPPELRKAHQENDRAVMAAYGFSPKMTESECVAELFRMYQKISTTWR